MLFASRAEVEAGDIHHALTALQKLLNPEVAKRLKGRLIFGIRGYDDDSRDLWEIPEVRLWLQDLDKSFPHWFYFMDLGPHSTLNMVVFSLCGYEKIPQGKLIPPDEMEAFLLSHVAVLNKLSVELGESSTEIGQRRQELDRFFCQE